MDRRGHSPGHENPKNLITPSLSGAAGVPPPTCLRWPRLSGQSHSACRVRREPESKTCGRRRVATSHARGWSRNSLASWRGEVGQSFEGGSIRRAVSATGSSEQQQWSSAHTTMRTPRSTTHWQPAHPISIGLEPTRRDRCRFADRVAAGEDRGMQGPACPEARHARSWS